MKKFTFFAVVLFSFGLTAQDLVLTGAFDGPLTGGVPKAVELYVINDISDLSTYGFGSANNGGGSDGVEFALSGSAEAGDFIYIATEETEFENYFGFAPDFTSNAAAINGDDALELFENVVDDGEGNLSGDVIDTFGDIDMSGAGENWDYLDGWVYRENNTGPDGATFEEDNWIFSGIEANVDETSNDTAENPWPLGTYTREPLSLEDNASSGFKMYPNPSHSGAVTIKINTTERFQIAIYDVLGKQVYTGKSSGNSINISSLKSGIYLVQVTQNSNVSTKKLIVK